MFKEFFGNLFKKFSNEFYGKHQIFSFEKITNRFCKDNYINNFYYFAKNLEMKGFFLIFLSVGN